MIYLIILSFLNVWLFSRVTINVDIIITEIGSHSLDFSF
ncbi:hypothetical protein GLYMA_07G013851v4 [Glycine max]|nr:hypothetical protein GLYMA_07G013851v4 [Glycine max]KAH1084837.1 hypothetical protein GYH30_017072 [Glycine max]